jgi:hypothetical protein
MFYDSCCRQVKPTMFCSKKVTMIDTDDGSIEWICKDGHRNTRRDQKLKLDFKIADNTLDNGASTGTTIKTVQVTASSKVAEKIIGMETLSLIRAFKSDPSKLKQDLDNRFNTQVFRFHLDSSNSDKTNQSISITVKDILD